MLGPPDVIPLPVDQGLGSVAECWSVKPEVQGSNTSSAFFSFSFPSRLFLFPFLFISFFSFSFFFLFPSFFLHSNSPDRPYKTNQKSRERKPLKMNPHKLLLSSNILNGITTWPRWQPCLLASVPFPWQQHVELSGAAECETRVNELSQDVSHTPPT